MKNQHIKCLENVFNSIEEDISSKSLKEPHSSPYIIKNVFTKIENSLIEFRADFSNLKEKSVCEIMSNLSTILGYGLGSTPESDDIFLGILAAIYCFRPDLHEEFEFLSNFTFERYTTSKSAKLFRKFLKKNFPLEIIPFLNLLRVPLKDNQTKFRFEQEICKIRAIGTSSGINFLFGVLWEIQYYEKQNYINKY